MSFRKVVFVAAVCGGCGPGWWGSTADKQPLFPSEAVARHQLEDEFGWKFDRDLVSGRRTMLCSTCRTRSECTLNGCEPDGEFLDGRLPTCKRCCRVIRADTPTAGHPERVLAPGLPDVLADLERMLAMTGDQAP